MTRTVSKTARKATKATAKTTKTRLGKSAPSAVRPGTKTHILITLLDRPGGATAEELMDATGWKKHSVQGFIAGTVKKKMGLAISSEKQPGAPRRYRIIREGE